jgi:hypothetical protein
MALHGCFHVRGHDWKQALPLGAGGGRAGPATPGAPGLREQAPSSGATGVHRLAWSHCWWTVAARNVLHPHEAREQT